LRLLFFPLCVLVYQHRNRASVRIPSEQLFQEHATSVEAIEAA
jgi:hypothetical protein